MAVAYQNQVSQYKRMKIETASPETLILMLYDGAIKSIGIAQENIEDRSKIDLCSNQFIKAQNIITELMCSLNFEIGGDIARNLFNIYEFINYTLAQANIQKTSNNLDTVTKMLKDLRETWAEVIRINKEKYPNGIPKPVVGAQTEEAPLPEAAVQAPEPHTPEPQAPVAPAVTQPGFTASRPMTDQNRFKQVYGKPIPRKI